MDEDRDGDASRSRRPPGRGRLTPLVRALIEAGFIIFLFYSNLLMGEYTHANNPHNKGLLFAVGDIFTATNFSIAVISATVGYIVVEYLRRRT